MAESNLKLNITGDSSKLNSALNSASSKVKSFGSKLSGIGSQLQSKLALPLTLIGGASIKMALDFDKSMTQIESLVGVASNEVKEMGNIARQMALATGKSSGEAAEALFYITSAGLRGADAMDVLKSSLQAAAVGLGETKTIADLSTSAMNAYGIKSLSASQSTDILTAAVREGKLEASALAGAMGGVIPLASNMGVSFDQVGAAMAAMSKTGTDAATGATQLTAILASLKKPTSEAEAAMTSMGMSTESVQKSLSEKGLLATLEMLQEGLKQTGQDTTAIFPNIRALKGVLDLTGAGLEDNRRVFEALSNTMGATQEAFDKTSKSASFQFQASINSAKETLVSLGQQLLVAVIPVLQKMVGFIKNLYSSFASLEPVTQKIIIGVGLFAAALPTLITLVGTLTTIIGALLSPIALVAAALAGIAYIIYKNWNEILPVVTGLYNQFVDLYNQSDALRLSIFGIGAAFHSVFTASKALVNNFMVAFKTMWSVIKEFSEKGIDGSFGDIILEGVKEQAKNVIGAGKEIGGNFAEAFADGLGSELEHKTQDQIQTSLSNAVDNVEDFVGGLASKVQGFFNGDMFSGGGAGAMPITDSIKADTEGIPAAMEEQQAVLSEQRLLAMENAKAFNEGIGEIITGGLNDLAVGIGDSLGKALAGGGNLAKNLSKVVLGTIGNMAVQMGKLAISIGIGVEAIKKALQSLNPAVAIAAGIALVALGSFAKSQAGKIGGGATAFANGGIVSGPTMGLVGEYPGARSNPEVIAPLNKLQGMLGGSGGTTNVNVGGQIRLEGQDLLIAIERATETSDRIS
jgi:TP901 family phage tail tape measure protein